MVFDVCRGMLADPADAEDAFQATFLVLSQKAGSLKRQEALASWLYGIAHHLALKIKARSERRRTCESRVVRRPPEQPLTSISVRDAQEILGQGLARLPDKLRAPPVLCYLEGLTQDEAAEQFEKIIVKSGQQGQLVYLRDVVRDPVYDKEGRVVESGIERGAKNYDVNSYLDGQPSITLAVGNRPSRRLFAISDGAVPYAAV